MAPFRSTGRSGKVKLSLLLWLAVLGVLGYYGFQFGGMYWQRYKLEEMVTQELSFAGQMTDEGIRQRILEYAAAMDPPLTARNVRFVRTDRPRTLGVSISYEDTVNLLFTEKQFPMSVEVRRSF